MFHTKIAGILNITKDSFSDGGKYIEKEKAIDHAFRLVNEGADAIDVGAISSNPYGKDIITEEEEIQRLKPVLEVLIQNHIPVSVDTWRWKTQMFCLNYEIDFLNDIQGFSNQKIYPYLRDHIVKLVVMHQIHENKAKIEDFPPEKIIERIINFFDNRLNELIKAGIPYNRIFIDPGMGFFLGTNYLNSVYVINAIPELKKRYKLPVYISVSKKSFLGAITDIMDPNERNYVTLACEIELIKKGVDWIRTHSPKPIKDSMKLLTLIQ